MVKPKLPPYGILVETHLHGPDFSTALHSHAYHSLVYIVSGKGTCIMAGRAHKLEANHAILLQKRQLHQFLDAPKNPMTVFVVYFNDQITAEITDILSPLLRLNAPIRSNPFEIRDIRALLREMLYEQTAKPQFFDLAIKRCFLAIMLKFFRSKTEKSGEEQDSLMRVSKVLDYIERHYYEQLDLSEAAKMAGLSQRQFRTIVTRLKKQNFVQFINAIRIHKASQLLKTTTMPVSAVAFEVGFEDLSTFYRQFKKIFHSSPRSLKP